MFQEPPSSDAKLLSQLEHNPYHLGTSAVIKSNYEQEKHPTKEERSQTNLLSESHPFQRSSLISNHSSNAKVDSCEILDKSSILDLSPTPNFVHAKGGRYSSSLTSIVVGSKAPLQDNKDCNFMGNQEKTKGILVEKVTRR